MSENPYVSGTISTKSSAPGIIVATGNIGAELSYNNVGMFVSSDAGNSWRPWLIGLAVSGCLFSHQITRDRRGSLGPA
ncbi:VPS10 domain-containing receptor SorCS3 [Xenotaenia resolanae]|uniref:VPS10 domain-containing receptor SorCS3 n=1 Tax=Xenotaenia resolanae TaxID=208358 RepID=A0ABV0VQN7_9TELE